jgi:PTS system mannose-specific IIA component
MIGLVLVTHGRLALELVAALEHVVGPQETIATVCIGPDDDMEQRRQEIVTKTADVNLGDGVIVLTDMFGGTPSNLAISIMEKSEVEIIAGVNLPMLIKLASIRGSHAIDDAATEAQDAGRKYINIASQLLKNEGD